MMVSAMPVMSEPLPAARPLLPRQAYTVPEFRQAYRISQTKLYDLWKKGEGPDSYLVGSRRMISVAAAERWQRKLEEQS